MWSKLPGTTSGSAPKRHGPSAKDMEYIDLIQWPAMVTTVVAAWLVASQQKRKREFGFWCSLLSNVLKGYSDVLRT
jgi:hypothetical protein